MITALLIVWLVGAVGMFAFFFAFQFFSAILMSNGPKPKQVIGLLVYALTWPVSVPMFVIYKSIRKRI